MPYTDGHTVCHTHTDTQYAIHSILCVRVKINRRSFEPFRVWILEKKKKRKKGEKRKKEKKSRRSCRDSARDFSATEQLPHSPRPLGNESNFLFHCPVYSAIRRKDMLCFKLRDERFVLNAMHDLLCTPRPTFCL